MDPKLDDDQQLFAETTRRFLEAESPLTSVRALEHETAGFDREWWRRGAELGWTSMLVSEADGGGSLSGAGLCDLAIVAEEMGRLVSPGPLLPTNVVAAAVSELGTPEQKAQVLPGILAGESIATWCLAEPGGQWDAAGVQLSATPGPAGDGFVLSGRKAPVEVGAQADWLLVTARTADGLTHFLLPATAPGVTTAPMGTIDLVKRCAAVDFDGVEVAASAVLGHVGGGAEALERWLQIAVVLQCAETVGATSRVLEFTLEYLTDRYSFGRPLASYQALKHRFADMKMWLEACLGVTTAAAREVHDDSDDAAETVSAAKSYVGDHATEIIQDCVQLHGGIGVTWEHDIHLYLRRVAQNRGLYGTPSEHRERVAALLAM